MSITEKSLKNLRPTNTLSKEEHLAISKKGGEMNRLRCKKRKDIKDIFDVFLSMPTTTESLNHLDDDLREISKKYAREVEEKSTLYDMLAMTAIQKARMGDVRAMEFVRDSVGDAPNQKQEIEVSYSEADLELMRNFKERTENGANSNNSQE